MAENIPQYLKGVAIQPCCSDHCRDWRETSNGKIPASDHSPECKNFIQKRFKQLTIGGSSLIDTESGIEEVIKEL